MDSSQQGHVISKSTLIDPATKIWRYYWWHLRAGAFGEQGSWSIYSPVLISDWRKKPRRRTYFSRHFLSMLAKGCPLKDMVLAAGREVTLGVGTKGPPATGGKCSETVKGCTGPHLTLIRAH